MWPFSNRKLHTRMFRTYVLDGRRYIQTAVTLDYKGAIVVRYEPYDVWRANRRIG